MLPKGQGANVTRTDSPVREFSPESSLGRRTGCPPPGIEERLDEVRHEGESDMNAAEQNKCAHPQCSCPVSQGQQYCSEACEISAAGSEPNAECGCDHPQCQMAA